MADQLTRRELLRRSGVAGAALLLPSALPQAAQARGLHELLAAERPRHGGKLRVGFVSGGASETLDPHKVVSFIDGARAINLFDGLTSRTPDRSIAFDLAESIDPSRGGTVWQIKLRPGVVFHDGSAFTADDVLYTWRRILGGSYSGTPFLSPIDLARTKKTGPHEIRLVLKRPIADVPRLFSLHVFQIVKKGAHDFSHPIGTGPFSFKSFTPGQRSVFARNPHYWAGGKPYVDELQMISFQDNAARLNAVLSGQLDAMEQLEFAQAKAQRSNPQMRVIVAHGNGTSPMYMRVDRPPFNDIRVRQAMKLAVDRPKTVDVAFSGFGTVGNDVFGKGFPSYDKKLPQHHYDPDHAKFLLKKAGKENLQVKLLTAPAGPGLVESATAYAEQARAAGIKVIVDKVPAGDLFNTAKYYMRVPFGQTQWTDESFEEVAQQAFLSNGPFNETHWHDASWDKRFIQAQGTLDASKRNAIYADLEREIWDRGGYIIWGLQDVVDLASSKLRGIVPNAYFPLGRYDFKSFWFA